MKNLNEILTEVQDPETLKFENVPYSECKSDCNNFFVENLKWTESRAKFPRPAKISDNELSKAFSIDKKLIKDSRAFFALSDGKRIGFVMATLDSEINLGYIFGLYMSEGFRKQRIGGILFSQARRWLTSFGAQEIEMLIKGGNEASLSFYRSLGFEPRLYVMRMKGSKFSRKNFVTPHNRLK